MGLFERLGRKVGELQREVEAGASEQADFVCTACEAQFYTATETCPECGSEAIDTLEDGGDAED